MGDRKNADREDAAYRKYKDDETIRAIAGDLPPRSRMGQPRVAADPRPRRGRAAARRAAPTGSRAIGPKGYETDRGYLDAAASARAGRGSAVVVRRTPCRARRGAAAVRAPRAPARLPVGRSDRCAARRPRLGVACCLALALPPRREGSRGARRRRRRRRRRPPSRFEEKAAAMGIDFTHVTGARGEKWMPETMGGGVAVLDYDGDGRPDLLFVSGAYWPGDPRAATQKSSLALYRNEGNDADGLPRFRNVTREAGLERVFYGMGASVGDYDNDGRDDVYVTALDGNYLFHNLGGRFEEVGTARRRRRLRLGHLLRLARLRRRRPARPLRLPLRGLEPGEGPLLHARRQDQVLLHARALPRDAPRTSTATSAAAGSRTSRRKAGVDNANQKALGVAPWDFDGDGRIDLLVANDTAPNNLFRNQGDGTFEDVGIPTGVAVDEARPRARRDGRGLGGHEERQGRGARDRQLLERAQVALLDRHGRGLPRRVAAERRRPDVLPRPDLRRPLLRRRPRRADGPAARQRPRRADRAAGAEGRHLPAGADPLP